MFLELWGVPTHNKRHTHTNIESISRNNWPIATVDEPKKLKLLKSLNNVPKKFQVA